MINVLVSLSPAPLGPSAALESVPAVLIRRAAVSLHHSIDGDLRHDRQFHDRGSLLPRAPLAGGLSPLLRTPAPRSDTAPRTSSGDFPVRRSQAIRQRDRLRATALTSSGARPVQDEPWDQTDREDPDQSPAAITARRTGCPGSSRTVSPTRSPVPQSRSVAWQEPLSITLRDRRWLARRHASGTGRLCAGAGPRLPTDPRCAAPGHGRTS